MAGFADIDDSGPLGSANANTIDNEIKELKTAILEGVAINHDDGQTTAAHQGYLRFEVADADPTLADRPTRYIYLRTTSGGTDTSRFRRNNGGTVWANIGVWLRELLGAPFSDEGGATEWATALVNTGTETTVAIEAANSSPRWYLPAAKITGATHVVVLAPPDNTTFSSSTANVWVWIERNASTGNVELHIYNNTGTNYNVSYAVARIMWN